MLRRDEIFLTIILFTRFLQFPQRNWSVLPRLARCKLSRLRCHSYSLLLSSYLCRIKRKNLCGHQLQYLTHFLLDCPASEPFRRAIFGIIFFSIFDLVQTLGRYSTVGLPRNSSAPSSFGKGQVALPEEFLKLKTLSLKMCEVMICYHDENCICC